MTKRKEFFKSALTIAIFASVILALSGACTGIFMSNPGDALSLGLPFIVPSGCLLWASIRTIKQGVNIYSAWIFTLIGSLLIALCFFGIYLALAEARGHAMVFAVMGLIPILGLIISCAILGLGIAMFRRSSRISQENIHE